MSEPRVRMFLNGSTMQGQPNHPTIAGAVLLGERRTAPRYRFLAFRSSRPDTFPGLLPDTGPSRRSVPGELYEMTAGLLHDVLMPTEPVELVLGEVELEDGEIVHGMLVAPGREHDADVTDITDITEVAAESGGWRAWLDGRQGASGQ